MALLEKYYLDSINTPLGMNDFGESFGGVSDTILREDIQLIDPNSSGGGTGTGIGRTNNTETTTNQPTDTTNTSTADEYTIRVTTEFPNSNPVGATVYLNNIPLPNTTPNEYKVKLSTLFTQGPQTVEVKNSGYISNQKYVLEVSPVGDTEINDITLLEDAVSRKIYGINNLQLKVKYFENNQEKTFTSNRTGTFVNLPFILEKNPIKIDTSNQVNLTINLSGPNSSVLLSSGEDDDFLETGENSYDEDKGLKVFIKSPNTTLYRISEITIKDNEGNNEVLNAGRSESLSAELVLTKDLIVDVISKRVVKKEVRKPTIRLKSNPIQKYNINDGTDIPLVIEKNDAVRVISLIIGNEILEFDNLKKGKYVGIKIPNRLIDKIGTYKMKLLPYSVSELEKGQKEQNVKELPPPPPPKTNPNIVKEQPVIVNTVPPDTNTSTPVSNVKYSPVRGGSSSSLVEEIANSTQNDRFDDVFGEIGGIS